MESNIVVVGSCMIDFVSYTSRLPKSGETIAGKKFITNFGGKGANQCIAAAKLGGNVSLVARVGDDIWGDKYIENLKCHSIGVTHVMKSKNCSTGVAQIIVADSGENQIVIVPSANLTLSAQDVRKADSLISEAAVVVMQLETSQEVALEALKLCKGVSIFNGAPATSNYDPLLLTMPTIFCINESEASVFTGLPVTNKREAELAAMDLLHKGCNSVLITLGAQGAMYVNKTDRKLLNVASPKVNCVDSTGAGDAFIGALAFLIAKRKDLSIKECLEKACIVAADSVTRPGTQISFPGPEVLSCKRA